MHTGLKLISTTLMCLLTWLLLGGAMLENVQIQGYAQQACTPPKANAGPDQSVQVGQTVQLDGSKSSQPSGCTGSLSFAWSFISKPSGSQASLTDSAIAKPTFVADVVGEFKLRLTVKNQAGSDADLVTITSTPQQPPVLQVSPTSLSFSAQLGQPNPSPQSLNITNAGGGTLNWTATTDSPWLSVSPTSGTAPSTVTVSANIANLSAGSLLGRITISAPGATNSPLVIQVGLNVTQPGPRTINVPKDFSTIQAALNAASSGTTIEVSAGIYRENLLIDDKQDLILQGEGSEQVTLDGSAGQQQQDITPGIRIRNGRNISIKGFKVINSRRGLEASNSTGLTIAANDFENNLRQAIALWSSDGQMVGDTVHGTKPDLDGSLGDGVYLDSTQIVIESSTINSSARCGVNLYGDSKATIQDSTISNNSHAGIGLQDAAQIVIQNSKISGSSGGGVSLYGNSSATIQDSTISNNGKAGIGLQDAAQGFIQSTKIFSNDSGIVIFDTTLVRILGNTITTNTDWGIWAVKPDNIAECRGNTVVNNGANYNDAARQKCS